MKKIKEMDKPENCCNCWFDYILTLQRGTSKTYCALELSKQMSRLIDADKLLEKMSGHCDVCQYHCHRKRTSCSECDWHEAMGDVDDMDDVEPVRHGHWIDTGSGAECSVCHEIQYGIDSGRFYCQNCGAKMDEVQE